MGTTITTESTLDHRYLMNKSKHELASMYLDLHKIYWRERDNNTPRPTYGMKILLDTSLPPNVLEIRNVNGDILAKLEV